MSTGFFIAIEGGEGAGKSTQVKMLEHHLSSRGFDVLVTREPGGTPIAEKIRKLLLDPEHTEMPDLTEALLFAAARADHAHNVIRPALERGSIVICDRYIDSSVAYQGYARGLGPSRIRDLSEWATDSLLPDFTIFIDVSVEESMRRMEGTDRMEKQTLYFHVAVQEAFRQIAASSTQPHAVFDGSIDKDDLSHQIRTELLKVLPTQ